MVINFQHHESSCSAYTVYEPSQIKDTIIVYMLDQNSELGYEVIFFKKGRNNWDTTAGIKIKHPATYHALCKKLTDVFPGNVFVTHHLNGIETNEEKSYVA